MFLRDKLPSEIFAQHDFHTWMTAGEISLPKIHFIVKDKLTQYIRAAKGYAAVLDGIPESAPRPHSAITPTPFVAFAQGIFLQPPTCTK
jgi:hypothetical protein